MPMPQWGGDMSSLNFDEITYYVKPSEKSERSWDEVPEEIKQTFDKLGIPEAEQKYLAGVSAQYESEVVYHNMKEDLEDLGIVFKDTDSALKENEDIFREHWAKVIPPTDNKFAALKFSCLVRRFIHLCTKRSKSRYTTSSLFPDQLRKYGSI